MAAAIKLQRHIGRRRAARFLAEGPNLVEAALRRGLVSEVFATEAALDRFAALLADAPVQVVTERAAKALSDTVTPVGLVAVCRMPEVSLGEVLAGAPRLVAVAVETSEPGNAGTLIRLADAMGADAMILAGNSVDPFNGKCLRSSAGSIFGLPVVQAPDVDALMAALRAAGLQVLATTLDGETSLPEVDLTAPTAWLFGSEAHGLSPEIAAAAATLRLSALPRMGIVTRASAAAAICLYASAHALS